MEKLPQKMRFGRVAWLKFILCDLIGLFVFFFTVKFRGASTIPLDVICTLIREAVGSLQDYVVLVICAVGALLPFLNGGWKSTKAKIIFSVLKVFGALCAAAYVFDFGPRSLLDNADLLPFLFGLGRSLSFLVPVGAVFLSFLTSYGLMDLAGVFMQPLMRTVWKTPGRSAVDAVASFVGSYSVALLITDAEYRKGAYTKKEAAIIATGFSTVSSTFMVTVASTLGMMDRWNLYFWSTLIITFAVTAITVRMFPLDRFPDEYKEDVTPRPELRVTSARFSTALDMALTTAQESGHLGSNILHAFLDGLQMTCAIVPSILSVGLMGMLLAMFTPIFKPLGYLFYPFTAIIRLPEALTAAQALATSIVEMYLPCAFVTVCSPATRYVVAVCCISELLFFSAVIPCILSTEIPVRVPQMLMIWVERVILSILLSGAVALILF